jgi:ASC-1-like (ASCH) protein
MHGRLNNGKYQKDDIIVFSHALDKSEKTIQRRVVSVEKFPSYKEALEKLSERGLLDDLLPGVTTVEDGLKIYLRNVTMLIQERHGVVLMELDDI